MDSCLGRSSGRVLGRRRRQPKIWYGGPIGPVGCITTGPPRDEGMSDDQQPLPVSGEASIGGAAWDC